MWNALRTLNPRGYHFRRQVPLGRGFRLSSPQARHRDRRPLAHLTEYDAKRDRFMEGEGYRVIRVTNDHLLRELSGLMLLVEHALGVG